LRISKPNVVTTKRRKAISNSTTSSVTRLGCANGYRALIQKVLTPASTRRHQRRLSLFCYRRAPRQRDKTTDAAGCARSRPRSRSMVISRIGAPRELTRRARRRHHSIFTVSSQYLHSIFTVSSQYLRCTVLEPLRFTPRAGGLCTITNSDGLPNESSTMTENSSASRPAPMEGGGAYNRSSSVQAAGLSPAVPLFEQAAKTVPLPTDPTPIVIADYGSSEGRNSLAPMSAAIRTLRNRVDPECAISVVHTDLAGNDFSALFQTLADDSDSYLRNNNAVFVSAVGRLSTSKLCHQIALLSAGVRGPYSG
jgi:hypothetical protein